MQVTSNPSVLVVLVVLLVPAVLVVFVPSPFFSSASVMGPHMLGQVIFPSKPGVDIHLEYFMI